MRRLDGFGRSLSFAAVTAIASITWIVMVGPVVGTHRAIASFLATAATAYVIGLAPAGRARAAGLVLGGMTSMAMAVAAPGIATLCVGLAAMIGAARGLWVPATSPGAGVVREVVLLVSGLVFASWIATASVRGVGIGLWAFFLVQSFLFLGVPRRAPRRPATPDPFDAALAKATTILGRRA